MRAPRTTRILSFLLALVFCLYLVPTEALAAELRTGSGNSQNAYARDIAASDSADIVSEIVSSRDKYQKEYILSNGQRLLTIYPTAVHYEDEDGLWQEIDNTLCTASVNGKSVYRNTAGIWDVTLPSSLSGNDAVSLSRGDSTLRFRFAGQLLQDTCTFPFSIHWWRSVVRLPNQWFSPGSRHTSPDLTAFPLLATGRWLPWHRLLDFLRCLPVGIQHPMKRIKQFQSL